ncbi:GntR family transcriptional regulator [Inquilinus sp.]|jgi:DNA-binding GntR family transcriptional regulator|uniref:GntR family transcriptional regulator n=1 Tax=Inquilinus sp. TaxID=1932117 RepID=UPI003783CC76
MYDHSSPFAQARAPGAEPKAAFALKRLRRAVIECELRPGTDCSEPDLAQRFGLGRAAVRTSLVTLAAEGLVAVEPRRGWRVAPVTGALIGDVIRARTAIEPGLAEIRLPHDTAAGLTALTRMGAALHGRDDRQALVTLRAADRQILDQLAARAGGLVGRWLDEAWNQADRIAAFFDLAGRHHQPVGREPLIAALAAGDAAAARSEIAAALTAFQDFATAALLSLPSSLDVAGVEDGRRRRQTGPATARGTRPDRSQRQGDIT